MVILVNKNRTKIQIISMHTILTDQAREAALQITKEWNEPTFILELIANKGSIDRVTQFNITEKEQRPTFAFEIENCCK